MVEMSSTTMPNDHYGISLQAQKLVSGNMLRKALAERPEQFCEAADDGFTVAHSVAMQGSLRDQEALCDERPELLDLKSKDGFTVRQAIEAMLGEGERYGRIRELLRTAGERGEA